MKPSSYTEREKGITALIFLALFWGVMPLFPRFLDVSFELFQQMYLRMLVGSVFLFMIFNKSIDLRKTISLPFREIVRIFLRSFIYYFLGVGFYTVAILNTKVSNVSFIGAIPMTAILGFIFLREKVTLQKILLILISVFGVLVVSFKELNLSSFGVGEFFTLLSAFFISLGLIARRWQTKALNDYEASMLMLFFAAVQLFIASLVVGEGLPFDGWTTQVTLVLFIAGFLNSGISFAMNYGFARVDAVLASNITSLSVVFATIFAFLIFREFPVTREIIGGGLIMLSAFLLHKLEKKNS